MGAVGGGGRGAGGEGMGTGWGDVNHASRHTSP